MNTLTQNITSQYLSAANALQSKDSRRRIIAYVEAYDDVLFWRTVLSQFEDSTRYFEVMLPVKGSAAHTKLGRGKKNAIQSLMRNTGSDMIACVDADYDYLVQGRTENSRMVLQTPYVFHTFGYAIENMQCYAPGLHNACVMVTLNDHRIFDFEAFLRNYSTAIWPLFVWSVAIYRRELYDVMSITEMDAVIVTGKFSIENAGNILNKVRAKAQQRVNQLRKSRPDIAREIPALRDELKQLGITPETTYLYIHGHHLFEKVVAPMVSYVCSRLVKEREWEIHRQSVHRTQMNNELSCYANSLESIESMLKKNTSYMLSPLFRRISDELRKAFPVKPAE